MMVDYEEVPEDALGIVLRGLGLEPSTEDPKESATRPHHLKFDTRAIAPYVCQHNPILLAVSVGLAHKFEDKDPTQWPVAIGLAKLDTAHLEGFSPGDDGCVWKEFVQTEVYTLAGRQDSVFAPVRTADCQPAEVKAVTVRQLSRMFTLGDAGSVTGDRQVIMICDNYWLNLQSLQKELGRKLRPLTVGTLRFIDLYNARKPAGDPKADSPDDVFEKMGLGRLSSHNVKTTAAEVLSTVLSLAVRAAQVSTSTTEPMKGQTSEAAVALSATTARAEAQPTAAVPADTQTAATVHGSVATATAISAGLHDQIQANTAQARTAQPAKKDQLILKGPGSKFDLPSPVPDGYFSAEFTSADKAKVRFYSGGSEAYNLPDRLTTSMARAGEITSLLENLVIERANFHGYPNKHLRARSMSYEDGEKAFSGGLGIQWESVAEFLKEKETAGFHPSLLAFIEELIKLRTFSSDWFDNMRIAMGFREDCGIQKSTDRHRKFIEVLVGMLKTFSER